MSIDKNERTGKIGSNARRTHKGRGSLLLGRSYGKVPKESNAETFGVEAAALAQTQT